MKNLNEKINSVISKANSYKEKVFREESEEEKAKSAIKAIIDTKWSKDSESAYKNIQLLLGLASNESESAKKFIKKIDDLTSELNVEGF